MECVNSLSSFVISPAAKSKVNCNLCELSRLSFASVAGEKIGGLAGVILIPTVAFSPKLRPACPLWV